MKIGVNARLLANPYVGIGQHIRFLYCELAKIDQENEYSLITAENVPEFLKKQFPENLKCVLIPEKKYIPKSLAKTYFEQVSIPKYLKKEGIKNALYTYPANPWSNFIFKDGINIVTVHDAIVWKLPEYQRSILSKLYHFQTKKALKKADKVVTVSESSKNDLIKYCGLKSENIEVVYNDVNPLFKTKPDDGFVAVVLKKFGLKRNNFLFYCGGYEVRKNIEKLIKEYDLYQELCMEMEIKPYPLVLAGQNLNKNKLYFDLAGLKNKENVILTGFIEENELRAFYSACFAFIHLSKEEGFNIPILEAANQGAPLIVSDIPVHREIAGENAKYVDLEKNGEVAKYLISKLDKDLRAECAEDLKSMVGGYSWSESAKKYKKIIYTLIK